jgi:hypothetical protein
LESLKELSHDQSEDHRPINLERRLLRLEQQAAADRFKDVSPRSEDRMGITALFLFFACVLSIGGAWAMFGLKGFGAGLTCWGVVAMVITIGTWSKWDKSN